MAVINTTFIFTACFLRAKITAFIDQYFVINFRAYLKKVIYL